MIEFLYNSGWLAAKIWLFIFIGCVLIGVSGNNKIAEGFIGSWAKPFMYLSVLSFFFYYVAKTSGV